MKDSEWKKTWNKSYQYLRHNIIERSHKALRGERDGSFKGSKEATVSIVEWVKDIVTKVAGVQVTKRLASLN